MAETLAALKSGVWMPTKSFGPKRHPTNNQLKGLSKVIKPNAFLHLKRSLFGPLTLEFKRLKLKLQLFYKPTCFLQISRFKVLFVCKFN